MTSVISWSPDDLRNTLILLVALHDYETWMLKEVERRALGAFERRVQYSVVMKCTSSPFDQFKQFKVVRLPETTRELQEILLKRYGTPRNFKLPPLKWGLYSHNFEGVGIQHNHQGDGIDPWLVQELSVKETPVTLASTSMLVHLLL